MKPSLNEYEQVIADAEKSIGWEKISTVDLCDNIKRYSKDFVLNLNGFNLACQRSKMQSPDMTDLKTQKGRFFSRVLKLNGDIFSEKTLVISAIALA